MPTMKTSKRVIGATLMAPVALALTALGAADEWVFEGNVERDAAVTRPAVLDESSFFSSLWAEVPSNVVYGFDTTLTPGFMLFFK